MRGIARGLAALFLAALLAAPVGPAAPSRPLAPRPALAASAGWPTYHLDNLRDANDTGEPAMSAAPTTWTSTAVDGRLFATPIVWNGLVFAATENNSVYAFNEGTGQLWWSVHLAAPVNPASLSCNNPASEMPSVGITGTPAIDTGSGTLYAVGLVPNTSEANGFGMNFVLWGIDSRTGHLLSTRVIDYPDLDPRAQGERGALAVAGGYVYIPFGGRDGDCTPYHPHIVAVPEAGGGALHYDPQTSGQEGAGIWAPGGEAVDGSGSVSVLTGNGFQGGTPPCDDSLWDHGDGLLELSSALAETGTYVPPNWCDLNGSDADLGSVTPQLVPGTTLAFITGKSGQGWVADTASLPGFTATAGPVIGGSCSGVYGGMASDGASVYVPCDNSLYRVTNLSTGPTMFTVGASASGAFSAPILAGGRLWALDEFGSNLVAFNPATLAVLGSWNVGAHTRFETLAADSGRIFTGTDTAVVELNFASVTPPSPPPLPAPGNYHPVSPVRLYDSRTAAAPLAANGVFHFNVAAAMYLAPSRLQAVDLNLTAIGATAPGYLAAYPGSAAVRGTSNVNFGAFQQAAAMVETAVDSAGYVDIYNGSGASAVHFVIDAMGYVSAAADGSQQLREVASQRVLDTRGSTGGHPGPLGPNSTYDLQVASPLGLAANGASAVVVNLTLTNGRAPGYLAAYEQGGSPGTSSVNYAPYQVVANRAIVPVNPASGKITLYNGSGTAGVDVVVDVTGYLAAYTPSSAGLFTSLQPVRVFDTRSGRGPLSGGTWTAVQLTGQGGVPASGVQAVVLTVTGTNASLPTYFTLSAAGTGAPASSDLNLLPGLQVANLAIAPLDSSGRVWIYNSQGSADAIVDVAGWISS